MPREVLRRHKEVRRRMAEAIKMLREANRLSQHQLAKQAAVSQTTLANAELGRRAFPSDSLATLCEALHVTPDQLLGFTSAPSIDPETEAVRRLIDDLQPKFRKAAIEGIRSFVDGLIKTQGGSR